MSLRCRAGRDENYLLSNGPPALHPFQGQALIYWRFSHFFLDRNYSNGRSSASKIEHPASGEHCGALVALSARAGVLIVNTNRVSAAQIPLRIENLCAPSGQTR